MCPLDSHCFAVSGFCILPTLSRKLRPATTLSATLELVVSHFLRWELSEKLNNVLLITWFSLLQALPLPWLHSESPSVLIELHPEPLCSVFITAAFAGTPYMAVQSQAVIQQSLPMLHSLMWAKSRAPKQVFLLQSTCTCASSAWNQGHLQPAEVPSLQWAFSPCYSLLRGPFLYWCTHFLWLNYMRSSNRSGKEQTLN